MTCVNCEGGHWARGPSYESLMFQKIISKLMAFLNNDRFEAKQVMEAKKLSNLYRTDAWIENRRSSSVIGGHVTTTVRLLLFSSERAKAREEAWSLIPEPGMRFQKMVAPRKHNLKSTYSTRREIPRILVNTLESPQVNLQKNSWASLSSSFFSNTKQAERTPFSQEISPNSSGGNLPLEPSIPLLNDLSSESEGRSAPPYLQTLYSSSPLVGIFQWI